MQITSLSGSKFSAIQHNDAFFLLHSELQSNWLSAVDGTMHDTEAVLRELGSRLGGSGGVLFYWSLI
jgi:hypothetical protein